MKTLRLTYQLIAIPAAFSLSTCHTQSSQQQPTPPNIIYILADDMGYGDINAFNPHSQIPTPTLDSMASAGIMFTDAHSNSSVSTPTRYGTLTGRYAFRSSLKKGVLTGYSSPLIEKGRETIASFLSNQGYQTACIGKWHLGLDWVKKDAKKPLFTGNEWNVENTDNVDYTAYISGGPTDCGFGYSCILPASLDMPPYIYIEDGKVTAPVNGYTEDYLEKKVRGARYRHGDVADDFNHQECLSYFTQKSEEYIARASRQDTPYFLYLALTAPPRPMVAGRRIQRTLHCRSLRRLCLYDRRNRTPHIHSRRTWRKGSQHISHIYLGQRIYVAGRRHRTNRTSGKRCVERCQVRPMGRWAPNTTTRDMAQCNHTRKPFRTSDMLHRFVRYTCRHAGNNIAPSHGRRQFQFLARTIRQKNKKRKQGTAINGVSFRKRFLRPA